METEVFVWAMIFVAFVIAEVASVQLVSIWFAVGALAAMLAAAFFNIGLLAQFAVFTVTTGTFLALPSRSSVNGAKTKSLYIPMLSLTLANQLSS